MTAHDAAVKLGMHTCSQCCGLISNEAPGYELLTAKRECDEFGNMTGLNATVVERTCTVRCGIDRVHALGTAHDTIVNDCETRRTIAGCRNGVVHLSAECVVLLAKEKDAQERRNERRAQAMAQLGGTRHCVRCEAPHQDRRFYIRTLDDDDSDHGLLVVEKFACSAACGIAALRADPIALRVYSPSYMIAYRATNGEIIITADGEAALEQEKK